MQVNISKENELLINRLLASGHYTDAQAVVDDALSRMDEEDKKEAAAWDELRAVLAPRIDAFEKGEVITITVEELIEEAKRQYLPK